MNSNMDQKNAERFLERELYNGEIRVKFDNVTHRYYINDEPAKFTPSKIAGVLDKPALIGWAVKETIKIVESRLKVGEKVDDMMLAGILALAKGEHIRKRDEAASEGTIVHDRLERWIKEGIAYANSNDEGTSGAFYPDEDDVHDLLELMKDKPEALRVSMKQFGGYLIKHQLGFTGAEEPVYSKKYGYPGLMDANLIKRGKGWRYVGDHKIRSGIYEEVRLQTALYQGAAEEEKQIKYKGRIVFHFGRKDEIFTGEFNAIEYKGFSQDFKAAIKCLDLLKWKESVTKK